MALRTETLSHINFNLFRPRQAPPNIQREVLGEPCESIIEERKVHHKGGFFTREEFDALESKKRRESSNIDQVVELVVRVVAERGY